VAAAAESSLQTRSTPVQEGETLDFAATLQYPRHGQCVRDSTIVTIEGGVRAANMQHDGITHQSHPMACRQAHVTDQLLDVVGHVQLHSGADGISTIITSACKHGHHQVNIACDQQHMSD
jgi:hypothetical protein